MRLPRNRPDTRRRENASHRTRRQRTVRREAPMTSISNLIIHITAAALMAALFFFTGGAAHAANQLVAHVDISSQTMEVLVDGRPTFEWKVSTARDGYVTPTGSFKPTRLEEMWYSRKYDMSPMPHSVFFSGGYAVHATNYIKRLGTP